MKGNAIFYTGRGKLGNNVWAVVGGAMIGRAYQPIVRNPRTTMQLNSRERFTMLTQLGRRLGCVIKVGLRPHVTSLRSARNEFIKLNWGAISGQYPSLELNYDELNIAEGALTPVVFGAAAFNTPKTVTVTIQDGNASACDASANDKVYIGLICPELNQSMLSDGTATRSSESIAVTVPNSWQGMEVHVYGFVYQDKVNDESVSPVTSNSRHIGSGNIS